MNFPAVENNQDIVTSSWFIVEEGYNPTREREIESILAIGNGYIGTRDSLEEYNKACNPGTFVAGIYEKDYLYDLSVLVKMPDWTRIQIFVEDTMLDLYENKILDQRRYLDMKRGICVREWRSLDPIGRITNIKIIKFISLANKHELGKKIIVTPENYSGKIKVMSGIDINIIDPELLEIESIETEKYLSILLHTKNTNRQAAFSQKSEFFSDENNLSDNMLKEKGISHETGYASKLLYESWEWQAEIDRSYQVKSLLAVYTSMDTSNPFESSKTHLADKNNNYFDNALNEHINKLDECWKFDMIRIQDNIQAQKWANYAVFRLITAGEYSGNYTSIPARDLTGEAYKGHIFWDTEIYLLPFFTFTAPEIARNLLMYRYNTLDGARENAKNEGFEGAAFAWESTLSGLEMTPPEATLPDGEVIPIYSGKYENHIGPDIVYAIWQYRQASYDHDFLVNYGAEIIFEVARFCRSLLIQGSDELYHIYKAVGPDEYHDLVDDNAYTNIMVRFTFHFAGEVYDYLEKNYKDKLDNLKTKVNLQDNEISEWLGIKDKIYMGCDPETKIYEQFKGYFNLEYVNVKDYEPRTAPMDIILGRDKIGKTQVVKQPDVVMFSFLLAHSLSQDIIANNYGYYEPRTGHGSSLSPGIYSTVAARLGILDEAYKYFEQNARIDLNNNMGNASFGIHIASLGAVWISIVMGFAGMSLYEDGLVFDPHLPDQWSRLNFSVKWRGQTINVDLGKRIINLSIVGNNKVFLSVGTNNWKELEPGKIYSAYKEIKWIWRE